MDEKILRETFDHNLNESFRLKQLENGLNIVVVWKKGAVTKQKCNSNLHKNSAKLETRSHF